MGFLDAVATTFSLESLIAAVTAWVTYLFSSDGPIKAVIDIVVNNQILWIFLAFSICTIGISLLRRIRRLF